MGQLGWASIVVFSAALVGCSTSCVQGNYVPYMPSPSDQTLGSALSQKVLVSQISASTVDQMTHGHALLTNLTDHAQTLRYHYTWMDATSQLQGQNVPWSVVVVAPKMSQVIRSVAPNVNATNYTLEVCRVPQG